MPPTALAGLAEPLHPVQVGVQPDVLGCRRAGHPLTSATAKSDARSGRPAVPLVAYHAQRRADRILRLGTRARRVRGRDSRRTRRCRCPRMRSEAARALSNRIARQASAALMAAIHLGLPLPASSCGLPAGSGEQPSIACAGRRLAAATLLGLAPGGVYRATPVARGAGELLPHRFTLTGTSVPAVCSLWHFPAGHPGLPLTTTLLCGVRTFLGGARRGADATARPTRPSPDHGTGAPGTP